MQAIGQDIVELFGFAANDVSALANQHFFDETCPFVRTPCGKTNHDKSLVYGTCSVTSGRAKREVIICPKRLYAEDYRVLADAADVVWGSLPLIAGGTVAELKAAALQYEQCAIAFGQNSGREVSINSNGKLSMDWVIQRYERRQGRLYAQDYIGIEVQSIDITGNYRENWQAYANIKSGTNLNYVPNAGHGLNWANVHKRLIPQIIRKGNVYSNADRCVGFFFILPDIVYAQFEKILGDINDCAGPSRKNLSVLTYGLGPHAAPGKHRPLEHHRTRHHSLADIALAFTSNTGKTSSQDLDKLLKVIV